MCPARWGYHWKGLHVEHVTLLRMLHSNRVQVQKQSQVAQLKPMPHPYNRQVICRDTACSHATVGNISETIAGSCMRPAASARAVAGSGLQGSQCSRASQGCADGLSRWASLHGHPLHQSMLRLQGDRSGRLSSGDLAQDRVPDHLRAAHTIRVQGIGIHCMISRDTVYPRDMTHACPNYEGRGGFSQGLAPGCS